MNNHNRHHDFHCTLIEALPEQMNANGPGSDDDGFALLEAIIAIALASLALAGIYRTVGDAVHAASAVRTTQSALSLARAKIDSLASDGIIRSGEFSGAFENGLRWRMSVAPLAQPKQDTTSREPYWVVIESLDAHGRPLIRLETAKLAREATE